MLKTWKNIKEHLIGKLSRTSQQYNIEEYQRILNLQKITQWGTPESTSTPY